MTTTLLLVVSLVIAVVLAYYFLKENQRALAELEARKALLRKEEKERLKLEKEARARDRKKRMKKKARNKIDAAALAKKGASNAGSGKHRKKASVPTHPRFAGWIKGHTSTVIDFSLSPDGQFCAASCSDRTLRVTKLSDCLERKPSPLYISAETEFDCLSAICWAPATTGPIIVGMSESDRKVSFYRCAHASKAGESSSEKKGFKYELRHLKKRQFNCGLPSACNYIAVEQAAKQDLTIVAAIRGSEPLASCWGINGSELGSRVKPKRGSAGQTVSAVAASADCRFLAMSHCSPDPNIYVQESGAGFNRKYSMSLVGAHSKPVTCVAFGGRASSAVHGDIDRAFACSQDGTFSMWKIDVQYKFSEDAIKLFQSETVGKELHRVSVSQNGKVVAVAGGEDRTTIWLYALSNAGLHDSGSVELIDTIENAAEGPIEKISFSTDNKYVAASCATSKIIFLWNVVA